MLDSVECMDLRKIPTDRKVREVMRLTGWKQQRVAQELDVSQSTVNRWLTGSEPELQTANALDQLYERALGEQSDEILDTVPLVGFVGAGAVAHFYGASQGELDRVPAPDKATKDTVAVEVRGESLGAMFEHWLVYYDEVRSPVTHDMHGRLCVVGLPDDRVLIKQIRPSKTPGFYHLLSNTEPTITDVEVLWAAKVKSMEPR